MQVNLGNRAVFLCIHNTTTFVHSRRYLCEVVLLRVLTDMVVMDMAGYKTRSLAENPNT